MTDQRSLLLDATRVFSMFACAVIGLAALITPLLLGDLTDIRRLTLFLIAAVVVGAVAVTLLGYGPVDVGWSGWGALATLIAAIGTILAASVALVVARTIAPSDLVDHRSIGPWVWLGFVVLVACIAVGIALEFRKRLVRVFCTLALLAALLGLAVIGTSSRDLGVLDATRSRATVLNNERLALLEAVTKHNDGLTTEEDVRKTAEGLRENKTDADDLLAQEVLNYLHASKEDRPAKRREIDAIVTPGGTVAMHALVAELDAVKDPVPEPSTQSATAIQDLCHLGGGAIDVADEQSSCSEPASTASEPITLSTCPADSSGPVELRADLAGASTSRLADLLASVATCELTATQVAIGAAKGDALVTAQREIDAALAALSDGGDPIGLPDAIVEGAAAVTAVLAPSDGSTTELTAVGWLVLAGLLLIGYRWLEIQAGLHRTGPVAFTFEGKDRAEAVEAIHFKEAVLRNVREPGAVPGSTALAPVTDLLGAVTTPHGPVIKALLTVVQSVFATPSGYTIVASWRSGPAAKATTTAAATPTGGVPTATEPPPAVPASVFVQISETRTGRQLASTTIAGADANEAARKAGYWCAGWIIGRSRDVPAWARWDESSATALAAYDWDDGRGTTVDELTKEVSTAPTTSVLLVALGYRYDLDGKFGEAMELYARTRSFHPRYLVGRYRASASLAMLASSYQSGWDRLPKVTKQQIARYLDIGEPDSGSALLQAAKTLASSDEAFVTTRRVFWASLRRPERGYWLALLRTGLRRQLSLLARSGKLVTGIRHVTGGPEAHAAERASLELAGEQIGTSYQIAYNLACYRSLRREADEAIAWLYRALDHPYSSQLTKEWLRADPDLAYVRTNRPGDFEAVVGRAASDPYSNESTSTGSAGETIKDASTTARGVLF